MGMPRTASEPVTDSAWYKDAIVYELHVKTFHDSDGDGIGDFRGLTEKLDYLQELGITTIWLLPFYPSPLRDDGYDIADYFDVNPNYGTLDDFRVFLDAAHQRGLRVITELVINHTSDQNPWFQKSRKAVAAARLGDPRRKNIKKRGSFLKISRRPTGRGIRARKRITGIASTRTSPISISIIPPCTKQSRRSAIFGWA